MSDTPKFETLEEYTNWGFEQLSQGLVTMTNRVTALEQAVSKFPPPGADMIKYKIPEREEYSNLVELFDNLYDRLRNLEDERDRLKSRLNKIEGIDH
tara:strand:- start:7935 stop:8225 length:291 start_codon:yes stop_codon:yes gene_type:complete